MNLGSLAPDKTGERRGQGNLKKGKKPSEALVSPSVLKKTLQPVLLPLPTASPTLKLLFRTGCVLRPVSLKQRGVQL